MYHVLLYYKIKRLKDPHTEVTRQKAVCEALQLKGRILINEDGINGTVGGSEESIRLYREYMDNHKHFRDIDFKEHTADFNPFPRMQVRYRDEIITTGVRDKIDLGKRGTHISRDTFHKWLENNEDMIIIDMRNDYEWEVGHFEGAVKPEMKHFRDLKDTMDIYKDYKDKKVVMYCTGGIRCEPASAYFISQGFDPENVYQLHGGIVKYAEKYGEDGFFKGTCYVFDDRGDVKVGKETIGACVLCEKPYDKHINCAYPQCHQLVLVCEDCQQKHKHTCSEECEKNLSKEKAV